MEKVPANKNKDETEGYSQYWMDRTGGQFKGDKLDQVRANQLLVSLQTQLREDFQLTEDEKKVIRKKMLCNSSNKN